MFAINEHAGALCGRHFLHPFPVSFIPKHDMVPLDLRGSIPSSSKSSSHPDKLSGVCMDLSPDGNTLVACDSGKNIFVFHYIRDLWELFTTWEMEKRLVKVQIHPRDGSIILIDKTGDVYMCLKGYKTYSEPKKIIGHTSYVLDVVFMAGNKIATCDRDEKIRISAYPLGYKIEKYLLAHKDAIIGMSLIDHHGPDHLLSQSVDGQLIYWDIERARPIKEWNIFTLMGKKGEDSKKDVLRMKSSQFSGCVYISVVISGCKELPVFEMRSDMLDIHKSGTEQTLRLFGQARLDVDFIDCCWSGKNLYVFAPEKGTLKKYTVTNVGGGLMIDDSFNLNLEAAVVSDLSAFATFNRPSYPVKRRSTTEY